MELQTMERSTPLSRGLSWPHGNFGFKSSYLLALRFSVVELRSVDSLPLACCRVIVNLDTRSKFLRV